MTPLSLITIIILGNHVQRSINILLGAVCAMLCLTIPTVLLIGLISGKTVILGLSPSNIVLVLLTLVISTTTFSNTKTNILQGILHAALFFSYLILLFD